MLRRRLLVVCLAAVCFAALVLGCAKPKAPTVTPRSARVTNVSMRGVEITADLIVYNPNDIDLTVKSVTAKVTLDKKYDVGEFTDQKPVVLPAKKKTIVKVPIKVQWADVMGLADLATSNRDVDYLIDGDAQIGGDVLSVTVPFTITGTVTHAELMKAAGKAMPKGIQLPF